MEAGFHHDGLKTSGARQSEAEKPRRVRAAQQQLFQRPRTRSRGEVRAVSRACHGRTMPRDPNVGGWVGPTAVRQGWWVGSQAAGHLRWLGGFRSAGGVPQQPGGAPTSASSNSASHEETESTSGEVTSTRALGALESEARNRVAHVDRPAVDAGQLDGQRARHAHRGGVQLAMGGGSDAPLRELGAHVRRDRSVRISGDGARQQREQRGARVQSRHALAARRTVMCTALARATSAESWVLLRGTRVSPRSCRLFIEPKASGAQRKRRASDVQATCKQRASSVLAACKRRAGSVQAACKQQQQ